MSDDDLLKRLWESDEASALTNQAARRIEKLEAKLAKAVKALDNTRLVLAEYEPHPLPVLGKVLTTLTELKGEKDA
jgi:ABC-type transporter Mla subunit MlaD